MHRRLWEEHITYFIEVNKIQIYPIRSLIVTHYSVWSILHNYPQCWQTICSVKVNKLQIALWDTAHSPALADTRASKHCQTSMSGGKIYFQLWMDRCAPTKISRKLHTKLFKYILNGYLQHLSITCRRRQTIVKCYGSMQCKKYK